MRLVIVALLLAFNSQPMAAEWHLSDLFKPPKKKTVRKPIHKKHATPIPRPRVTPTPKPAPKETIVNGYFVVDEVWMARYRVLEAIWDYEIPEDTYIGYADGRWYVPPVVYRHYEDMAKTPHRATDRQPD